VFSMSSELGVRGSRVMCDFTCHFSVIRDHLGSMTSGRKGVKPLSASTALRDAQGTSAHG